MKLPAASGGGVLGGDVEPDGKEASGTSTLQASAVAPPSAMVDLSISPRNRKSVALERSSSPRLIHRTESPPLCLNNESHSQQTTQPNHVHQGSLDITFPADLDCNDHYPPLGTKSVHGRRCSASPKSTSEPSHVHLSDGNTRDMLVSLKHKNQVPPTVLERTHQRSSSSSIGRPTATLFDHNSSGAEKHMEPQAKPLFSKIMG